MLYPHDLIQSSSRRLARQATARAEFRDNLKADEESKETSSDFLYSVSACQGILEDSKLGGGEGKHNK